jgi:hypothetical protein
MTEGSPSPRASLDHLPWNVLRVLAAAIVRQGDIDGVRAARLVCKPWRAAIMDLVTGAALRPLTRAGQDVNDQDLPMPSDARQRECA